MNKLTVSMLVFCTYISLFAYAADKESSCSAHIQDNIIALTDTTHINIDQTARIATGIFAFTKAFYTIKELIIDETGGRIYGYNSWIPSLIINDYTDAISWSIIGFIALYKITHAEKINPVYYKTE